ncbi:MAG: hypothetical protein ACRDVW_02240 [Acidimicrobiales bacterium]
MSPPGCSCTSTPSRTGVKRADAILGRTMGDPDDRLVVLAALRELDLIGRHEDS